jgi:arylsulfatase A-like enzyme
MSVNFMKVHQPNLPHPDFIHQSLSKSKYADSIVEADTRIGHVMDKIRALGLDKNTYVFWTTDNGALAGCVPGRRLHATSLEQARRPARAAPVGFARSRLTFGLVETRGAVVDRACIAAPLPDHDHRGAGQGLREEIDEHSKKRSGSEEWRPDPCSFRRHGRRSFAPRQPKHWQASVPIGS